MIKIILASASPRRRELLEQIGLDFCVEPAQGEETVTAVKPNEVVEELSIQKAMEISAKHISEDILVIGADTIVALDGRILGKPADREDACAMLRMLSGRTHEVYTGVTAILQKKGKRSMKTFSEATRVTFFPMTDREIEYYVNTKEPMDKAGAYGIQGIGARYVQSIQGDYNNVVGLPVGRLYQEIIRDMQLPGV